MGDKKSQKKTENVFYNSNIKEVIGDLKMSLLKIMKIYFHGGSDDPLRQMLFMMMNMLMEMEATRITGGEKGVHTKDRNDYRSGTRQRRLDTRLGTFNLEVPKFRKSGYVPFFMKYKQRSELALISMIVEAYTNGVSTRKIKHLAESLGIENISASEVSVMNKNLDGMVEEFRIRKLEKEWKSQDKCSKIS